MRNFSWTVAGLVLGVITVVLVGMLSIQVIGVRGGAVFNWRGELVSTSTPRIPVLPMLAIAAIGLAVIAALYFGIRPSQKWARSLFALGFFVATVTLIIVSFALPAPEEWTRVCQEAITPGWQGWLERGGSSPAVHIALLVSLAVGALTLTRRSRRQ